MLYTNKIINCCVSAAFLATPSFSSVNNSSNSKITNNYYLNTNYNLSKYTNSSENITVINTIDAFEIEANLLISKIEKDLNLKIDDKFIPNKSENNITLFITCNEFREFCKQEKYQEAYELEMKIKLHLNDDLINLKKIGRIAFL